MVQEITKIIMCLSILFLGAFHSNLYAQFHDDQKQLILKSTENGPWKFLPAKYIYREHRKYSGGHVPGGFLGHLVHNPRFYENRSNIKRVGPRRLIEVGLQTTRLNEYKKTVKEMESLVKEETANTAQRLSDLVYDEFKDYFTSAFSAYEEVLTDLRRAAKNSGHPAPECDFFEEQLDLISWKIDYIHKTGSPLSMDIQIEPAERRSQYYQCKEELLNIRKPLLQLAVKYTYFYKIDLQKKLEDLFKFDN